MISKPIWPGWLPTPRPRNGGPSASLARVRYQPEKKANGGPISKKYFTATNALLKTCKTCHSVRRTPYGERSVAAGNTTVISSAAEGAVEKSIQTVNLRSFGAASWRYYNSYRRVYFASRFYYLMPNVCHGWACKKSFFLLTSADLML